MESQAKGTFENSEILIKHADLILAYLEKVEHDFRDDGKIMSKVKGNSLNSLKKFINDYDQSVQRNEKLPSASSAISEARESLANELAATKTIFSVDYACCWLQNAHTQLQIIYENTREFDIRWNLPVTLRVCKLFVAFCKICMFLHYIKNSYFLTATFCYSNAAKNHKLMRPLNELVQIVKACDESPFSYVATKHINLKTNLSILIFQILPFFSTLFADWPMFDWSKLSFYEFSPEDTIGNSMPLDDFTLLANIYTFQETMAFFLLTYPSYMDVNPQFTYLASGVLSESPLFYFSRNFSVKTNDLISLSLSAPENKENSTLPFLRDNFDKTIALKNRSTHIHRMKQLYYLAEDIENFAEIDFNQFLRCIHQVRAICAFSYYEIENFFRVRDQKLWDRDHVTTVMNLFALVDKITELFIREQFTVERFFIYNLSTADAQYLQTLVEKFKPEELGKGGGANIIKAATVIKDQIQSLDLSEFDQGVHYDFYPLLLTHGRLLRDYNAIVNNLHITYLNPLFEHLCTIADHCNLAMDATRCFFEYCPIHTFWRHHAIFTSIIKSEHMPMNTSIIFMHVFSYFNYDNIVLPCLNMIESLKGSLQNIKALLSQQIRAIMGKIISAKKAMKTNNSESSKLDYENSPNKNMLNPDHVNMKVEQLSTLTQANQFVASIPESIFFFGNQIDIASFFINSFQNDFIRVLLFKLHDNTHSIVDAAEFLWSLMGKIGIDFRQALFNGITGETMFASPDIKEQVKCFLDPTLPKCPQGTVDEQRIVHKFALELISFINGGHKKTKYVQFTQQFFALTGIELRFQNELAKRGEGGSTSEPAAAMQGSPMQVPGGAAKEKNAGSLGVGFGFGNELDGSLCFSTQHFADLFRTLGLHCALYLDSSVIMTIATNLIAVVEEGFKNFTKLMAGSTKITEAVINSPEMAKASEALLSLSVGLTIRAMIRRATKIIIDETIPGLSRIISTHIDSQNTKGDDLMLLKEVSSDDTSFYFIEKFLAIVNKSQTQPDLYFTYIATLILSINWNDIMFYPDYDALWQNYHLIPYAFQLLLEAAPFVLQNTTPETVRAGVNRFFLVLSVLRPKMTRGQNFNPFFILIDKFMKFVPDIDYGDVEQLFPYTLLSSGYPSTTKANK